MAGEQLGLQRFQAVIDVVVDLDAGFLLESLQCRRVDVVGPIIYVQHPLLLRADGRGERQQGEQQQGVAHQRDTGGTKAAWVPPSTGMVVPVT